MAFARALYVGIITDQKGAHDNPVWCGINGATPKHLLSESRATGFCNLRILVARTARGNRTMNPRARALQYFRSTSRTARLARVMSRLSL